MLIYPIPYHPAKAKFCKCVEKYYYTLPPIQGLMIGKRLRQILRQKLIYMVCHNIYWVRKNENG